MQHEIIPDLKPGTATLIFGVQGTGKSHAAQALALRFHQNGGAVIAYDPLGSMPGLAPIAGFIPEQEILADTFRLPSTNGRPLLLVMDEAHRVAPKGSAPPAWVMPTMAEIRHLDLAVLATTQHPSQLSPKLRTLATSIFAGRCPDPSDIGWLNYGGSKRFPDDGEVPARSFVKVA